MTKTSFTQRHPFTTAIRWLGISLVSATLTIKAATGTNQITAANINVVQNDTNNTAASITLSMPLAINDFRVINGTQSSRADYYIQIGASATDNVSNGMLISSIDQNGRDNGESGVYAGMNYGTSAIDSGATTSPGSSGQWWIPVFQAPTDGEYNFNVAAAYFPYAEGWLGGWLNNASGVNGGANNHFIGTPGLKLGTNVIDNGSGRTTVDLRAFGMDSRSNAVLLAVGGKNEGNFALAWANTTNGTWTVFCRDDNGGYEEDYIGFVCVPLTNHTVIAGKFFADNSIALESEPFNVTQPGIGTYHLTIPNVNPASGVLIISAEGGGSNNSDNIVSYQMNGDGWDIQTRDLTDGYTPELQDLPDTDAVVSFVFIPAPAPGELIWAGAPENDWGLFGDVDWRSSGSNTLTNYVDGNQVFFDDSASNFTVNVEATVSPSAVTVTNSAHNFIFSGTGKISGNTGLTKQGSGKLTLATINDYTGDTVISQGTLTLGAAGAIPSGSNAGNVTVNGTLDPSGFSSTINNLSGSGAVNNFGVGAMTLTVNEMTNTVFSGVLENSGGALALSVNGSGTLTLSSANYFAGGVDISNATLAISGTLGTSHVTVESGGTLAGSGIINNPVVLATGSSLLLTPNAPLFTGALTLTGAVNVVIAGNISLTNAATYTLLQHTTGSGGGSFTLTQPPGLQCYGFTANLLDSGTQLKLVVTNAPLNGTISDVRHVVFLMNENRSYDHYFGTLHGGRGFDDRNALTFTNGYSAFYQPTGATNELPFHTTVTCITDMNHSWPVTHAAFDAGWNDQWIPNKGPATMAYYERTDLPYYYELADAYTVCDEYHASAISCTFPNRVTFMTGMLDPHSTGGGPEIDNTELPSGFTWKTYPEMLQAAGVSWKIYQVSGDNSDNVMKEFAVYKQAKAGNPLYDRGMVASSSITALVDALEGDVVSNTLPSVSWIIGPTAYTEHPPYSSANGQLFTKELLDAVASNPDVYKSTVFIVNYDENDGFFDHAMPILPPAGTPDEFIGDLPIGLGVRVPAIIASPWTRGGRVCSQVFDHTSMIRFLELWTGVKDPNISAWRRQVCGDLTSAFDFAHPDYDYPASSFTDVTGITCPSGITPVVPTVQTAPAQEAGTLTPLPLPYQPNAFCTLNSTADTLAIMMTNSGTASVHFGVTPNAFRDDAPQPFDVSNATSASTTFSLSATSGKYDFSCRGPNGFQRRFAGTLASDYQKIEAVSVLNPVNGGLAIALENLSAADVIFTVTNGYTTHVPVLYSVLAHSTNTVSIGSETNSGFYDVTVTANADSTFVRRFLGRVEVTPLVAPSVFFSNQPASGNFQFNFSGPANQTYQVLATTNLASANSWSVVATGTFGNSAVTYTETNIAGQSMRFYRVISP